MLVFVVKLVDTNGVVSADKIFDNKSDAESYIRQQEQNSTGWELQLFQYTKEKFDTFSIV